MSIEFDKSDLPLEERVKKSPIHIWSYSKWGTSLERVFEKSAVPEHLREPLHEIFIMRGGYPPGMKMDDPFHYEFMEKVLHALAMFEVLPKEQEEVRVFYQMVITQWSGKAF